MAEKTAEADQYLPTEITEVILLRLPAKSLLRLQSVSKQWKSMIRQPNFTTAHLEHYKNDPSNTNRRFFLEARLLGHFLVNSEGQTVAELGFPLDHPCARQLCSCEDIVLVRRVIGEYFLFNPFDAARHRSLEVPFTPYQPMSFGVCYDRMRDDHVVVAISRNGPTCAVYSYKRNSWTENKKLPRHGLNYYSDQGVCVGGKLYWLSFDGNNELLDTILCFDPSGGGGDFIELHVEHEDFRGCFALLCDLRGHLCFCSYDLDEVGVRILVMKGPNSWEKGINISGMSIRIPDTSEWKFDFFERVFAQVAGSGRVKHQLNGLDNFRQALVPSLCNLLYPLGQP